MGYLDTARRTTRRRAAGGNTLNAPAAQRRRRNALNDINAKSHSAVDGATAYATNDINAKSLPPLDAGPGSPALRLRVLQLGEAHGYPALSLGRYRYRKRTAHAGLIAGRGWWQHQTTYFGDGLLAEAVRQLEGS